MMFRISQKNNNLKMKILEKVKQFIKANQVSKHLRQKIVQH
jgi:hypothetical protein